MTSDPAKTDATPAEKPFQFRLVHLLVAMALVGGALGVFVPMYRAAQEASHQSNCSNNLRQIALALHSYHDTYRQFPPAYHVDATGKPAHSWRLLIWPFAESTRSYETYDFAQPWNGPNNSKLHAIDMWLYRCPGDHGSPRGMTNYVAIVGKGTMWPGSTSSSLSDVTGGPGSTILIVEIAHSDIHWMEPRDLPVEELEAWLKPGHKPQLLGNHIEGGIVAFADGSVHMMSRDVTIDVLKRVVTPDAD